MLPLRYRQGVGQERGSKVRVVKEAQERRNEILDVAERLFCTKGFDATSTGDILNEVGIARGTLYYHFKSKEEILDAMIERITCDLVRKASAIANNESIPVLERLVQTILALNLNNDLGEMVMEQIHKPQNALLHQKMQSRLLAEVNPMITGIIRDGIEQGIFQTAYPEGMVEMTMLYSNTVFDDLAEDTPQARKMRILAFTYNVERMLGMQEGSLMQSMQKIFWRGAEQEGSL